MIKLIIQSTPKCLDLLKYIKKDIDIINKAGYQVKIEIATTERIEMLASNNINRLPVMIAPDGSLIVGIKEIMNLIEKNITIPPSKRMSREDSMKRIPRAKRSVDDFLHDAIYEGVEMTDRGMIAKQEQEYEDDHFDYDKERKKVESKHGKMRHRNLIPDEYDNEEEEIPQTKKAPARDQAPKRRPPPKKYEEDEYDDDEDNIPQENLEMKYSTGGSDIDSMMMTAMLSNLK